MIASTLPCGNFGALTSTSLGTSLDMPMILRVSAFFPREPAQPLTLAVFAGPSLNVAPTSYFPSSTALQTASCEPRKSCVSKAWGGLMPAWIMIAFAMT